MGKKERNTINKHKQHFLFLSFFACCCLANRLFYQLTMTWCKALYSFDTLRDSINACWCMSKIVDFLNEYIFLLITRWDKDNVDNTEKESSITKFKNIGRRYTILVSFPIVIRKRKKNLNDGKHVSDDFHFRSSKDKNREQIQKVEIWRRERNLVFYSIKNHQSINISSWSMEKEKHDLLRLIEYTREKNMESISNLKHQ
jgi:hypothetical protein